MCTDADDAIEVLQWQGDFQTVERVVREGFIGLVQKRLRDLRTILQKKTAKQGGLPAQQGEGDGENELQLMIPQSRNVFGACEPFDILKYGQCFFQPYSRGKPTTIMGLVVLGKNPCSLLGDIRVLQPVDESDMKRSDPDNLAQFLSMEEDLIDCIINPTRGKRQHFRNCGLRPGRGQLLRLLRPAAHSAARRGLRIPSVGSTRGTAHRFRSHGALLREAKRGARHRGTNRLAVYQAGRPRARQEPPVPAAGSHVRICYRLGQNGSNMLKFQNIYYFPDASKQLRTLLLAAPAMGVMIFG